MDVTIESDTLFEAYEAAESEDTKAVLRDAILDARPHRRTHGRDLTDLYPEVSIDADELVAELEEDDEPDAARMSLGEAREYLNEQVEVGSHFGAVIESAEPDRDLYVSDSNRADEGIDHFDVPEGWTARKTEDDIGIVFERTEAVYAPFGGSAPSSLDDYPDCYHSVVGGVHTLWAYEGSDAEDSVREWSTSTTPVEERYGVTEDLIDVTVETLVDGLVTDE